MAPTLLQIAESVQRQKASKWVWDVHHFAAKLGISVEQASCFLKCIEKGGKGVKKDGTWTANPVPYDKKIDLSSDADNILNLHLRSGGQKTGHSDHFDEPSPEIVKQSSIYVRLGSVRSFKWVGTVTVQKEIARYVMGTHQTLVKHWPNVAKIRQRIWRSWIDGESNGELFQSSHFPWIVAKFWYVWDTPIVKGSNPTAIPSTVLNHAKAEVVEMLVRMHIISPSKLDTIMVRRSRRTRLEDIEMNDVHTRKRRRPTPSPASPVDSDESTDNEGNHACFSLNYSTLRRCWDTNDEKQCLGAASLQIVALEAHRQGGTVDSANAKIRELGGTLCSAYTFENTKAMGR